MQRHWMAIRCWIDLCQRGAFDHFTFNRAHVGSSDAAMDDRRVARRRPLGVSCDI